MTFRSGVGIRYGTARFQRVTEHDMSGFDPADYRRIIGRFATGVAVVTAQDEDGQYGITVNSLTSVSLDPLLLLVCLTPKRPATEAIRNSGRFVVNLLDADQAELSSHFADKELAHDFSTAPHDADPYGPVLDGGIGYIRCTLERIDPGGDHDIFLGRVADGATRNGEPLLYYGGYRRMAPHDAEG